MVKELFTLFSENSVMFIIFLTVLVTGIIFIEKESIKTTLFYPAFVCVLVVLNPLFIYAGRMIFKSQRLVRIYWCLPVVIILAYICTRVVELCDKKKRMLVVALLVGIIVICGKYMFSQHNFKQSENVYKIPDEVIAVCEAIQNDGNIGILVPSKELVATIRQYDAEIVLAYGRDSGGRYTGIAEMMNQPSIDLKAVGEVAIREEYAYLLINKSRVEKGSYESDDLILLLETEGHLLYKLE